MCPFWQRLWHWGKAAVAASAAGTGTAEDIDAAKTKLGKVVEVNGLQK